MAKAKDKVIEDKAPVVEHTISVQSEVLEGEFETKPKSKDIKDISQRVEAMRFQFFVDGDKGFTPKTTSLSLYLKDLKPSGWNYFNVPKSLGMDTKKIIDELTQAGALRAMFIGSTQTNAAQ